MRGKRDTVKRKELERMELRRTKEEKREEWRGNAIKKIRDQWMGMKRMQIK